MRQRADNSYVVDKIEDALENAREDVFEIGGDISAAVNMSC